MAEKSIDEMGSEETGIDVDVVTFQSSPQRDFVILAARTPHREESSPVAGSSLDKEWVSEHARQVGR